MKTEGRLPGGTRRSPKLTVHLGPDVIRYLDRCRGLLQTDPTCSHVVTSAEVIRLAVHRLLLAMLAPMCDLARPNDAAWTEYLAVVSTLAGSGECPPALLPSGKDAGLDRPARRRTKRPAKGGEA